MHRQSRGLEGDADAVAGQRGDVADGVADVEDAGPGRVGRVEQRRHRSAEQRTDRIAAHRRIAGDAIGEGGVHRRLDGGARIGVEQRRRRRADDDAALAGGIAPGGGAELKLGKLRRELEPEGGRGAAAGELLDAGVGEQLPGQSRGTVGETDRAVGHDDQIGIERVAAAVGTAQRHADGAAVGCDDPRDLHTDANLDPGGARALPQPRQQPLAADHVRAVRRADAIHQRQHVSAGRERADDEGAQSRLGRQLVDGDADRGQPLDGGGEEHLTGAAAGAGGTLEDDAAPTPARQLERHRRAGDAAADDGNGRLE